MKKFIITFLSILPFTLFCQTVDSTRANKMEVGITYSPDYCYRTLKPDASSKWIAEILDTLEIPKFGYTTGLNFVFNINKKMAFETGVLYSDKGEKTKKYSLTTNSSSELPNSKSVANNMFIYHYHYFDIPIKINYYVLTKKVKLFLTAGISANIFLFQKTISIVEYNDGYIEKTKSKINPEFSRINFAVIAGLGINYTLTPRYNFRIEPIYRRSITSIIKAPIKSYFYSAGLNIGIYYKL